MLLSLEEKTRSNYGAGLLRFTQFCDSHNISEIDRCPASEVIISAFIASYAGLRSSDCINGWLLGIKCSDVPGRAWAQTLGLGWA